MVNRTGFKTGHANRWIRERVAWVRSSDRLSVFSDTPEGRELWLNPSQAALLIGAGPRLLRRIAKRGDVKPEHALANGPWIFGRGDLSRPPPAQKTRLATL